MSSPFARFFERATRELGGGAHECQRPYPYQERFATAAGWPHLLRVPTGAGKTATAVLGWLFRRCEEVSDGWRLRRCEEVPETPRRLVYCLPMRVLVEQSFGEILRWLHRLNLLDGCPGFNPDDSEQLRRYRPLLDDTTTEKIAVHRLMGGIEAEKWHLHPERPAILIGTQDMLLSRALNRGYAASRFHWPIDFGLLNNDCLWVYDEPQLMASGVSTSAQLAGLRDGDDLKGTFAPCPSVWMSATLEPGWLDTIDFRGKSSGRPLELGKDEYGNDYEEGKPLHTRMTAAKTLHRLGTAASKDGKDVAKAAWANHKELGGPTLVVLNTVERAKAVFAELQKLRKKAGAPGLLLVHSRFRPNERERLNQQLQNKDAPKDRIIVATQVVEAGVDISSRTLLTELAPWASIVQRIGRCNRAGDNGTNEAPARVLWIDLDEKLALPYSPEDLAFAREHLKNLEGKGVSPLELDAYKQANETPDRPFLPFTHTHVLRKRDLLGLFDTSPDLSGNDIDVKPYIRNDDPDLDVQVFWRVGPPDNHWNAEERRRRAARREELCNVPIGAFKKEFLEAGKVAHRWDFLDKKWLAVGKNTANSVVPGQVFWVPANQGGYDGLTGWEPSAKVTEDMILWAVVPPEEGVGQDDTFDGDGWSHFDWRSIADHTDEVMARLNQFLAEERRLPLSDLEKAVLRVVVRWHDWGKAHEVFQSTIKEEAKPKGGASDKFIAKAPEPFWGDPFRIVGGRREWVSRFRHELASALGVLQLLRGDDAPDDWQQLSDDDRDLALYLLAAHHGKVRLSVRVMPNEKPLPPDPTALYAAGVWDRDPLPETGLGGTVKAPAVTLDLSPMLLGGDSWTARMLRVRDRVGPFRLAYLEAIVRAADCLASAKGGRDG